MPTSPLWKMQESVQDAINDNLPKMAQAAVDQKMLTNDNTINLDPTQINDLTTIIDDTINDIYNGWNFTDYAALIAKENYANFYFNDPTFLYVFQRITRELIEQGGINPANNITTDTDLVGDGHLDEDDIDWYTPVISKIVVEKKTDDPQNIIRMIELQDDDGGVWEIFAVRLIKNLDGSVTHVRINRINYYKDGQPQFEDNYAFGINNFVETVVDGWREEMIDLVFTKFHYSAGILSNRFWAFLEDTHIIAE